jgi:hypothetical protein
LAYILKTKGTKKTEFEEKKCFFLHLKLRGAFAQSRVGLALAKAAALRINLNLDGAPIASKSHTPGFSDRGAGTWFCSDKSGIPMFVMGGM